MIKVKTNFTLLDVLVVFILATSIISVGSLSLNVFNVHASVILGFVVTLSIFWVIKKIWGLNLNVKRNHFLPILMLLLVGLLFRSEPYHYVGGGQDQGVYVNMSQYFENHGKIIIEDEVRKSLPNNLSKLYDSENLRIAVSKKHEKEGTYLPGIYVKDQQNSEYVFQFYHLHPLWMSIFGKLFGDTNRVYSLVFFSLLSIITFYLLAFEFTQRKYLSFGAGFLLAVNPLHAFFSKFPVTEVVALAFTLLSFLYLLKYYNLTKERLYFPAYLALSALLMLAMFMTRISGFMYLPFFYLILILLPIFNDNKTVIKQLNYYIVSVFLYYAISVWYGLVFSYPYASDVYRLSFQLVFGSYWLQIIVLLLGVFVLFYIAIVYVSSSRFRGRVKQYLSRLRPIIPYLFVFVLFVGVFKVYQLGFTEKYIGDQWYSVIWKANGTEWGAFLYWNAYVLVKYLSPFVVIVFAYILFTQAKRNDEKRTMLVLFVLLFLGHISVLQWFIPYQYYYARYLLSEALPFVLLFTLIGLDRIKNYKKTAIFLLGMGATYMLFFTAMQFKGKEMDGLHSSLSEIQKYVGPDDILIIDQRWLHSAASAEIKTPLIFYFNFKVLSVTDADKDLFVDYYCSKKVNVYLFGLPKFSEDEELLKIIYVNADYYERTNKIPVRVIQSSQGHYLSKVSCSL